MMKEIHLRLIQKRHDKSYPKTSIEMNKEIAGYVFHHTTKELSVDVHNPDILVRVEYRKRCDLYYG